MENYNHSGEIQSSFVGCPKSPCNIPKTAICPEMQIDAFKFKSITLWAFMQQTNRSDFAHSKFQLFADRYNAVRPRLTNAYTKSYATTYSENISF